MKMESLLFAPGEMVWLDKKYGRKGNNFKLQPKFVCPYHLVKALLNHIYLTERLRGQDKLECR